MQLHAQNVACLRAGHLVFSGLTFASEPGRALALTGPNGVGKSSLLRMIAGLLPLHAGHLTLTDPAAPPPSPDEEADPDLGPLCHYLGHRDAIKPSLSAREMLGFWRAFLSTPSRLHPHPAARDHQEASLTRPLCDPESALDQVGLGPLADLPCQLLSAGQRRRLTLARLLAVARPLWLLDEPTTALDTAGQDLLWLLCRRHLDQGGVVLVATHAPLPIAHGIVALDRSLS